MDNVLAVTIIFIVLSTVVAAFIRRLKRDKCLKDFSNYMVTVAQTSGKTIHGKLRVEHTGLELIYSAAHHDEDGHEETSFIMYKYEYPDIQALIRYHDELSPGGKETREKELKRTYHPGAWRRFKRKTLNVFKTIRDSVAEVVTLLISYAKKSAPVGGTLTSQDKYVSQMKQELMGSVGTSYEPLLERYIGHKVVLEMLKGDKVYEYCGVLKEYTAEFIEIMDVDYRVNQDEAARKADLVVLRKYGLIRHLGE
jgi:hypothetical protein